MSTATLAYPPPLSAAPTVETLERLLSGLQRPVERCVPTPPVDLVPERLFADGPRPSPVRARSATPDVPTPRPAKGWSTGMSWSAGNAQSTVSFPRPSLSTAAAAAAAVAALLAGSDLVGLP